MLQKFYAQQNKSAEKTLQIPHKALLDVELLCEWNKAFFVLCTLHSRFVSNKTEQALSNGLLALACPSD